jgi:hypothetical protein
VPAACGRSSLSVAAGIRPGIVEFPPASLPEFVPASLITSADEFAESSPLS